MDTCIGSQYGKIFHHDVARKPAETGNFAVGANSTIMTDMTRVHEQVAIADERAASTTDRAQTDGDVLPDLVLAPDFKTRRLTHMLAVLRRTSEARVRRNPGS